eukprot:NODE_1648_length_916_cov_24.668973_g1157_i0.p3 GENE.NODE_1648_length_916_cov_24.668973_g1157_i0~~NODE_1648_length_916_cov_24.668973_g1157_i0.p3  ORF type:complete len:75 (+),score=15.67 NODE_1648_length_916_cov_24.668973_g1157_i0:629-853(+)
MTAAAAAFPTTTTTTTNHPYHSLTPWLASPHFSPPLVHLSSNLPRFAPLLLPLVPVSLMSPLLLFPAHPNFAPA